MMKKWLTAAVCSMMIAAPAGFALAQTTAAGSKADYDAAVKQADADYKAATTKCDGMKANAKDVCKAEAKRDRDVAKAQAEARRDGTQKSMAKAEKTKADRDYDVAKEMCDDKKGNDKDVCKKDAKAAHEKALMAAKVDKGRGHGFACRRGGSPRRREEGRHRRRLQGRQGTLRRNVGRVQGQVPGRCEGQVQQVSLRVVPPAMAGHAPHHTQGDASDGAPLPPDEGARHELGPDRRQVGTSEGQDQGEVGQADRRRHHADQRQA